MMKQLTATDILDAALRLRKKQGGRARPSPSSVAKCPRQMAYGMFGVEEDNFPDNGESYISAESGRESERVLAAILTEAGVELVYDPDDEKGRELTAEEVERINCRGGQVDNVGYLNGEPFLVEFKRKGALDMQFLHQKGVREAQPDEYTQMQILMKAKQLEWAMYVAANWDRGGWTRRQFSFGKPMKWAVELGVRGPDDRIDGVYVEWVKYVPRSADAAAERAAWIREAIAEVDNPDKVRREYNPKEGKFPCTWCGWMKRCTRVG